MSRTFKAKPFRFYRKERTSFRRYFNAKVRVLLNSFVHKLEKDPESNTELPKIKKTSGWLTW